MKNWARLEDGIVVEVVPLEDDLVPGRDVFHSDLVFVMSDGSAQVGMAFANGTFALPPAPAASKDELLAYAAEKCEALESSGITINGMSVATDDRAKLRILGARVKADADQSFSTPWIGANGSTYTLDATTIVALSDAVLAHVAGCYQKLSLVSDKIATSKIKTFAKVDEALAA